MKFPYACIGQFSFVELSIAASPYYPEMLERVKNGHKLLDLGCAFGQELRQLVSSLFHSSDAFYPTICPN